MRETTALHDAVSDRPPQAVLFDLWGTIFLEKAFNSLGWAARIRELAPLPPHVTNEEMDDLAVRLFFDLRRRQEDSLLETPMTALLRLVHDRCGVGDLPLTTAELELEFFARAGRRRDATGTPHARHSHRGDQQHDVFRRDDRRRLIAG